MVFLILMACHPATSPEAAPIPAAAPATDPCAEGALDALQQPLDLESPRDANELAQAAFPPLLEVMVYVQNNLTDITGPDCSLSMEGFNIYIQGTCSYANGLTSVGELSVENSSAGNVVVARSFELRQEDAGMLRRYDGWLHLDREGDLAQASSVGTYDFRGPNLIALVLPSGPADQAFTQELCMASNAGQTTMRARVRLLDGRWAPGDVLIELQTAGSGPIGAGTIDVRGRSHLHLVGDPTGPNCYLAQRDGVDLGQVCMDE